MAVNNTLKLIRKLYQKKYRRQTGLFVAEGRKIIHDLLRSQFQIETIIGTQEELAKLSLAGKQNIKILTTDYQTITRISNLKTPQPIIAIARQKQWTITGDEARKNLVLALDNIQDPGNMGTILRLADWFGIKLIVASPDSVDVYNNKVVQASMGSIFRVPVVYTDLKNYLSTSKAPVYGTFLDGDPLNKTRISSTGIILMGNEAHGIREDLEPFINHRVLIPSFNNADHVESLNVAMATAIMLWEFRRNN